ncbi:MAG: ribosomal L7Ae/L30e/S12e/Gadd45 family protein [Clostridiales bacterium]|nr:ribosomal L7Ae/L30e/S12e/Gadd45 family protein [Clostridiales bacterium]
MNCELKVAGYLGIAQKAGKIAAGDSAVLAALENRRACLVLVATNAASSVQEEIIAKSQAHGLPFFTWGNKIALGLYIGKSQRGAVAVLDEGLANAIRKLLEKE